MALQAPAKFGQSIPKESKYNVILDSGASISISFDKSDFVGPLRSPGLTTRLKGIAKGLRIEGQGHIMWAMHDSNGYLRLIKVPAFYVPKCNVRLLSTTSLLQTYENEAINIEKHQLTFSGVHSDPTEELVVARVDPTNNLPTSITYQYDNVPIAAQALTATIAKVDINNRNLSELEKELLRWYYHLGHIGYQKVQFLMRTGVLGQTEAQRRLHTACCQLHSPPLCAACQFGQQKGRPSPGKQLTVVKDKQGNLKKGNLFPGQRVTVDHFVCSTKGRLFSSAGKTKDNEIFAGGCIFVDHATGFIHVEFQTHLNTHETLKAKRKFELMYRDLGVIPRQWWRLRLSRLH